MVNRLIDNTKNLSVVVEDNELSTVHRNKKSFKFDFEKGEFEIFQGDVVTCVGDEALKIWAKKCIKSKNQDEIYKNTSYGADIEDLVIGQKFSRGFIESELLREVSDALTQNEQIQRVRTTEVDYSGGTDVVVTFTADTDFNNMEEGVSYGG